MVILNSSMPAWIGHFLAFMGGCFGCCTKPTPVTAVDEPSKGLRIQGRAVTKPSISNDFWSSSTCDLDFSTVHSQRSISSISVSNQNPGCSTGGMSSNYEFVNHGLLLWQQSRLQWVGSGTSGNQNQRRWESRLSWNATEGLLGSTNPFPRPIPLSEMVDFLVDFWEQEGLYD
uniref:Gag1-like clamp domain-containing protein n=1 Tax=Salix viminalis TaxID=40686 RepID=A0A6N2N6M5_SALVM